MAKKIIVTKKALIPSLIKPSRMSKHGNGQRPDVGIYTTLVLGLATLLRVSNALRMINDICRVRVSLGEEIVFCAKCRYKYELISGNIISVDSEKIRLVFERNMEISAWKMGLKSLQILKQRVPTTVHSILVQTISGVAHTHRFATEIVELPAQEGERVTIACAAPSNIYRKVSPFKFSPTAPNFYPGELMCLTNHKDGKESQLLRASTKDGNNSILKPPFGVLLRNMF
ncbi:hypothetical protein J1N35_041289 [Gossypium stocksii]|uniref:Uncharacterized protein n=1 Tax=Gossypium stocksii TaxID=47602 RepID=A0A9D3UF78_9ROSI|nr:hypothetical protein J1N35_041289 [Gossypium stocksii]